MTRRNSAFQSPYGQTRSISAGRERERGVSRGFARRGPQFRLGEAEKEVFAGMVQAFSAFHQVGVLRNETESQQEFPDRRIPF